MAKSIIVDIDESGDVNIEAVGFKGKTCAKATKDLIEALGGESEFTAKPEYQEVKRGVAAKKTIRA